MFLQNSRLCLGEESSHVFLSFPMCFYLLFSGVLCLARKGGPDLVLLDWPCPKLFPKGYQHNLWIRQSWPAYSSSGKGELCHAKLRLYLMGWKCIGQGSTRDAEPVGDIC